MPAPAAPAPVANHPGASIVLIRDGAIDKLDTTDRKVMASTFTNPSGTSCIAIFSDESLGVVKKLHQSGTTKQCDVLVEMLDESSTNRTMMLNNMGTDMLAFIPNLLGGAVPVEGSPPFIIGRNAKKAEGDAPPKVMARVGPDGTMQEKDLLELLKGLSFFQSIFEPAPAEVVVSLAENFPKALSLFLAVRVIPSGDDVITTRALGTMLAAMGDPKATTNRDTPGDAETRVAKLEAFLCTDAGKGKLEEFLASIEGGFFGLDLPTEADSVSAKATFVANNMGMSRALKPAEPPIDLTGSKRKERRDTRASDSDSYSDDDSDDSEPRRKRAE